MRGFGVVAVKSELLLFVSVQPPARRTSARVVLGEGAGPSPSKQLAVPPYPTRSITERSAMMSAQVAVPVMAVVVLRTATLPAVADMAIVPEVSDDNELTPLLPNDSETR